VSRRPFVILLLTGALVGARVPGSVWADGPQRATEEQFNTLDKDGDGLLVRKEFDRRKVFEAIDRDGNGFLTLVEIEAYFVDHRRRDLVAMHERKANLPEHAAVRVSTPGSWDNHPAATVTADGTVWIVRVRHHEGDGDDVAVVPWKAGSAGSLHVLTPARGQYIRPVIAAVGEEPWCVWTVSEPDRASSIWYSRRSGDRWSRASRLLPDETRSHQNPEIAIGADGRVAVVYQIHTGTGYDIHLSVHEGKAWRTALPLSDAESNDWDPVVAFDTDNVLHVLWSGFVDGDYDVYWKRLPGKTAARRISARGEYDLHPWLAAAPDGSVWANWDVVRIDGHDNSGRTTITGANVRHKINSGPLRGARSWIEVRVLDDDLLRVPGDPRGEIRAPEGYTLQHNGLAKIAIGPGGEPWIFYRALRRAYPSFMGGPVGYFWEVLGRPFRDGNWGTPIRLANGDGYLEEAGAAGGPDGIHVVYGGERRDRDKKRGTDSPTTGERADRSENHHHDYDGIPGSNGDVHLASIAGSRGTGPDSGKLPVAPEIVDRTPIERDRVAPYEVTVGEKTYRLLWGDTHRHSNISRCSSGAEPSPDDLYRYGTDISRYDFFALSDHAEHLHDRDADITYYYWWLQQKLADLYHVPGAMSVLYNFEWTMSVPNGHHNVIFPVRPGQDVVGDLAGTHTLAEGWEVLDRAGLRAITIPHTSADSTMGTAWEIQNDDYRRLCEVFQSCRGIYEHEGCPRQFEQTDNKKGFYWNALEKGYRIGVVASSDHGFGVAYAVVFAPENTRESIWQAMWDRRTYGSTTYGLVLDVRSGEHWMGEHWSSEQAPQIDVFVRGAAPIRSVEILGRSQVLYAEGSIDQPLNESEVRLRWSDPDWNRIAEEQWYYVRVIQVDDEMAWSSPMWVTPAEVD